MDHVFADRILAGWKITQQKQGIPDSFWTPQGIFFAQLADQILHRLGNGRPPTLAVRLPTPEMAECGGVPLLDGGRFHQMGAILPFVQEFGKHHPQETESCRESRATVFSLLDPMFAHGQLALNGKEPGG